MSLDKLKASWGSLDDSVDKKEIVTIRDLRKELYNVKYKGLRSFFKWGYFAIFICLVLPLKHIFPPEGIVQFDTIYTLAVIVWYGLCIIVIISSFIERIKLNKLKMSDNIHTLKTHFYDYVRYQKVWNRCGCIILIPAAYASYIWISAGRMISNENLFIAFFVPLLVLICLGNALVYYMINRLNKKHNSMLEDIKQLEELDMY